jgi:hypothetical protein
VIESGRFPLNAITLAKRNALTLEVISKVEIGGLE